MEQESAKEMIEERPHRKILTEEDEPPARNVGPRLQPVDFTTASGDHQVQQIPQVPLLADGDTTTATTTLRAEMKAEESVIAQDTQREGDDGEWPNELVIGKSSWRIKTPDGTVLIDKNQTKMSTCSSGPVLVAGTLVGPSSQIPYKVLHGK